MVTQQIDIESQTSLSQKVVSTLSRIGVSSREVRKVVDYIRIINAQGLAEDQIPDSKHYIFRELAKDGIICKHRQRNKTFYIGKEES